MEWKQRNQVLLYYTFVLRFVHASFISSKYEDPFGDVSGFVPYKSEPRSGHCVFNLKPPIWEFADFICAYLCNEGGVLQRIVHIRRVGQNLQTDVCDYFFRALGLPGGILKMHIS